jgi:hypothetical protein
MDSDAEGVPSEFFDYFKVLKKILFFFGSLQISFSIL